MSFLRVKNIDERFDFQKEGYYQNWKLALTKAPTDTVLPLFFEIKNGSIITTFEARKVKIVSDEVILLETIALINQRTISAIATFAGGYKVTTSTPHFYKIGDIVTQSGFTGGDIGYNGIKTIVTIPTSDTYTVIGTFTSDKTGVVNKNAVIISQTNDNYVIQGRERLKSLLNSGLYYYFFDDGINKQKRSELFCIDSDILSFKRGFANNHGKYLSTGSNKTLVTI